MVSVFRGLVAVKRVAGECDWWDGIRFIWRNVPKLDDHYTEIGAYIAEMNRLLKGNWLAMG